MDDQKALTLEQFLELYPWPKQRLTARAVDWLWHFELPCETHEIWPHLIDTSRFNRALGLAEMKFTERDGVLHGSSAPAGIAHSWVEVPWTWVWCRELTAERIYEKGFSTYVRAIYRMESGGPGRCRVSVYFGLVPRNLLGRIAIALGRGTLEKGYARILPALAEEVRAARPVIFQAPAPELGEDARHRMGEICAALVDQPVHADAVQALFHLIETADDMDAHRIQVRRLARENGIAEIEVLTACLYATRAGLLELSWDVVCPHCRGVREGLGTLGDVTRRGRCDVCEIDFDTSAENTIEITFRIHPSIRSVPEVFYCSAEPAKKSHIRAQVSVAPGARVIETDLEPGLYRLRVKGSERQSAIDIAPEGDAAIQWSFNATGGQYRAGPHPQLRIENDSGGEISLTIEQSTWADTALRPSDVFGLQQFRDLFSEEYLGADVQLFVGEQTLVFTDMVGSTRFYAERGDPGAFVEVKRHFGVIQDILRVRGGAFVKSIGDAVMMVFPSPLDAVKTTHEIMKKFPLRADGSPPVRLRASMHTGSCIAVNLNAAIDYFGGTVNIAAKLQKTAGAGDITMSDAVVAAASVREYLDSCGAQLVPGVLESDAGAVAHVVWKTDGVAQRARGSKAESDVTARE